MLIYNFLYVSFCMRRLYLVGSGGIEVIINNNINIEMLLF
jgi:hypothetical protein